MIDGRNVPGFEMATVSPRYRAAAGALLELAQVTVDEAAQLLYGGDHGDYVLYNGESVTRRSHADSPDSATAAVVRPEWHENNFVMRGADGTDRPLRLNSEGLEGPGVRQFNDTVRALRTGALAGEHTVSAVKFMETPGDLDVEPMVLNVTVQHTSEGRRRPPVVAANLRLTRTYDEADMISQCHRIEHDPDTGLYRAGSVIISEKLVEDPSTYNPATGMVQGEFITDPFPAQTTQTQQDRFMPSLPVNRPLEATEWRTLMAHPLDPAARLMHQR